MAKKDVWVTGNRSDGYKVRSEGAGRAASVHPTQREAIDAARDKAQARKSELIVQDQHGRIRQKDSFGNDPRAPKDKR
ncbi:conserved hypothetical protein [Anaeromyxobacter dehalogenans 2CP-1]|uniref:DUF2188 domain-containing protein n=1 Tax=Anaeromyxobacter dehalogenans (strain ATCC BAA-258 / DSM 21875 / 2CP-1) TaxID=455488 RepID=B8JFN9_ANAD2|nr:DUF2188 domain-containing protein [Anaeromyxobacter dehalogenans]ACL64477.1 conserved hypothetical protein [Anaeromyxobacter dehalogenans 2CP-1]